MIRVFYDFQVSRASRVHKELQETQVVLVLLVHLDHRDNLDLKDSQDSLVLLGLLACLVNLASKDSLADLETKVFLDRPASRVKLVTPEPLASQASYRTSYYIVYIYRKIMEKYGRVMIYNVGYG